MEVAAIGSYDQKFVLVWIYEIRFSQTSLYSLMKEGIHANPLISKD